MVKLLIASLIAGVAIWLYLRSQNAAGSGAMGPSDAAKAAATPEGGTYTSSTGAVYQKLNGNFFLITPSQAMQDAAAAGATGYDPNNPDVAQRRLDALARSQHEADLAAAAGTTVDGLYQQHLAQSLADQQKETAVIMAIGGGSTMSLPPPPVAPQPQSSMTTPGVSTGPTVEGRRGLSHFGGVPTPIVANPKGSNADYAQAILNAGPTTPAPGSGYAWSYTDQKWEPLLV